MAGFVDALEQAILDHVLNDGAYTPPTNWFIGLSSTTPTETGTNFTEPSGGAYARVSTAAADWAPASGSAPATKANAVAKSFPQATADWAAGANLTHFGLFTASSGGTPQIWGAITVPKAILTNDTQVFDVGNLVIKLGDPGDTY